MASSKFFFAFYQLLASCNLVPKVNNAKNTNFFNIHNVNWSDFLNLPNNKEYSGSFSTDGVSCCLHLSRTKRIESTAVNNGQISPADTYIGIDPGLRLFLGGVGVVGGDPYVKANITHIKYKSSKYHFECGNSSRKFKLKKWTKEQIEIEKTRPATQTWKEYITFALRHIESLQSLKFDGYIRRDQTIAKIIREEFIKDAPGRVVVFFVSSMKGYIRSPHTRFIQQLKRHHQIHFVGVNEYNTTKVCSSCLSKAQHTISKSPHRFSSCKE